MAYKYFYTPSRYYRRHRGYTMPDGSQMDTLTTRYTCGMGLRPCKGPRGGKAYREYAKSVYYGGGKFWRAQNVEVEPGKYVNSLAPVDGVIWDVHQSQSLEEGIPVVRLECREGVPVGIEMDGEQMPMDPTMWPACEELLGLNAKRRKSPAKRA